MMYYDVRVNDGRVAPFGGPQACCQETYPLMQRKADESCKLNISLASGYPRYESYLL